MCRWIDTWNERIRLFKNKPSSFSSIYSLSVDSSVVVVPSLAVSRVSLLISQASGICRYFWVVLVYLHADWNVLLRFFKSLFGRITSKATGIFRLKRSPLIKASDRRSLISLLSLNKTAVVASWNESRQCLFVCAEISSENYRGKVVIKYVKGDRGKSLGLRLSSYSRNELCYSFG